MNCKFLKSQLLAIIICHRENMHDYHMCFVDAVIIYHRENMHDYHLCFVDDLYHCDTCMIVIYVLFGRCRNFIGLCYNRR